jgi:hypothetical protein
MECADEQVTQYRGAGQGYGPVRSEERVIFAVFQSTERDGNRAAATTFRNNQLTRYEFSLARLAHITREEFQRNERARGYTGAIARHCLCLRQRSGRLHMFFKT